MRKLSIPYTFDDGILDKLEAVDLLNIKEVYMPLPYDIMPSGRLQSQTLADSYKSIYKDKIKQAKDLCLEVNLLASKPILEMSTSITNILKTVNEITELKQTFDVDKITIGNLAFLNMYGEYFHSIGIKIELSVLTDIDSFEKIKYIMNAYPYLDSICLKSNMINQYDDLVLIKKTYPNLKLKILVNHLCLYNCPAHVQHHTVYCNTTSDVPFSTDNLQQIQLNSNYRQITQNCKFCDIYSRNNITSMLKDCAFIRPEDLHLYDDVIDLFKLSGREHPSNEVVKYIRAFGIREYNGNFREICDAPTFFPKDLDNTKFPDGYGEQKKNCNHKCNSCNYCNSISSKVEVDSVTTQNPFVPQ